MWINSVYAALLYLTNYQCICLFGNYIQTSYFGIEMLPVKDFFIKSNKQIFRRQLFTTIVQ